MNAILEQARRQRAKQSRPALQEHIAKFGALIRAAEAERRFLNLHFGLSNPQIAAMVQPAKTTLDTFANAALAAMNRRGQR